MKDSGIEWTDSTWNPTRGCSRVSEGCRNCYAESVAYRFSGPGMAYEGLVRIGVDGARRREWNGTIRFMEEHLLRPMGWGPVVVDGVERRRRIFVDSMSDLFHEGVTEEQIDRVFAVMALCPQHDFQVLTKRPKRMWAYTTAPEAWPRIVVQMEAIADRSAKVDTLIPALVSGYPLPNVRLGVSVEDQQAADARLDYLCEVASHGWQTMVSFEPLLSAVDPGPWWLSLRGRTWAIVGGESGSGSRPMHPDWPRGLRDLCLTAGVPFFFKQWGAWVEVGNLQSDHRFAGGSAFNKDGGSSRISGRVISRQPRRYLAIEKRDGSPTRVLQFVGKRASGHLLDGVRLQQFPEVRV